MMWTITAILLKSNLADISSYNLKELEIWNESQTNEDEMWDSNENSGTNALLSKIL
jgi:hypothetical protein